MNEKKKDKAAEKHGSRFYRTVYALLSGLVGFFLNIVLEIGGNINCLFSAIATES